MSGKVKFDWIALRLEWAQSGKKLAVWCREKGISLASAQHHIKARDRKKILEAGAEQKPSPSKSFKTNLDELRKQLESDDRIDYLQALSGVVQEVGLQAHVGFLEAIEDSKQLRPGELARVTLAAVEQLQGLRDARDAIPQNSDAAEWPLLRQFDPHWYQRDFVLDTPANLMETRGIEAFILAYIAGIGSGKTRCGAEKWGKICELNRGLPHGVFAPTYRMLEDVTKREFIEACARKGVPFQHRPSENKVILWGDTDILFRSLDNPDANRGPTLAAAWLDELLQMSDREAFDIVVGRVRHKEAKCPCVIVTASPAGFGWGYDVLVTEGEAHKVRIYRGATKDNVSLRKGYYETLLGLYDEKFAQQELFGEFIDISTGRAYYNFDRAVHVLPADKARANPDLPLILCVDFNVKPMHWVVAQSYRSNGEEVSYCIDEIYLDQSTSTSEVAEEFVSRYGKHANGVQIYGDATGHSRHTSATRTDYEIIEEVLKVAMVRGVEYNIGRSNPQHSERVKDVNARFLDARKHVHLYISDRCKQLIQDFERQGFVPGTMQLDKTDPLRGHGSDAVGYYVNREHAIRRMRVSTARTR